MKRAPLYDHVVFDLDGTIADTRADLANAVNHALHSLRLRTLPSETICEYIGEGARLLLQRSLGNEHQSLIDEALTLFLPYYRNHLLERTVAYPGIPEVVSALHDRGITISLLSNKPEDMSRAILDGLGLLRSFTFVLGGDSLPERKPDPAGIEHLLGLDDTSRSRMMLIGDSTIDLKTALAARIAFCGVAWGVRPGELLRVPEPPQVVQQAEELLTVVAGDASPTL